MNKKVIWVTGASTGIGKEIAKLFAKQGHIVIATARRRSRLAAVVREIKFSEGEAVSFICNVASERSVQITAKRIKEKFKKIDLLVNNAGVTSFKSFLESKIFDFDNVMNTNVRGTFLCTKAVLPTMIKNRSGHIINISSVAANTIYENSSIYSASKAALLALTNCLRSEIRKYNIKVTNILPGATETPIWDSKTRQRYKNKMMSPQDIANVVFQAYNTNKKVMIEDIVIRPIKGDL